MSLHIPTPGEVAEYTISHSGHTGGVLDNKPHCEAVLLHVGKVLKSFVLARRDNFCCAMAVGLACKPSLDVTFFIQNAPQTKPEIGWTDAISAP
jgi:hypothetical protein